MNRLFNQHMLRRQIELDGIWDFRMEGVDKAYRMPVPGCWEQHPDFLNHRGVGTYSRRITVPEDFHGHLRLEFKGVSHTADVALDGEPITHHYNAFTPFSAIVPDITPGAHELTVRVDNTFSEASALHVPNDYYTYGGITRPVSMELLGDVYVKRIRFTPSCTDGQWRAHTEVLVENLGAEEYSGELRLALSDQDDTDVTNEAIADRCASEHITVPAHAEVWITHEQAYENVKAWSEQHPKLYYLRAAVGADDLIERIGFRTVEVSGTQILLNGTPLRIKGFNRHEDYATVGCAIPVQLMAQDLDLMQEMNANAVRTCHYPNDERFLDLCDERGILVWEENHARGLKLPDMQNLNFDRQCEDCIREMIENHYNHPSIFIWGILNECASETPEGREKYARQYAQIRAMDGSRPVTSATCRHFTDICLDLEDVVSFNMYSGWYQDCPVDERNDREIEWIRRSGGAGKPIIVSEMGAAAMYGYRDRAHCKWSEERQADIIRENLEVYLNDPNITGVFIWQFADCRVTEEGEWFGSRARCHNNKGVVDEYRRPKLAFDTVREIYDSSAKQSVN